MWFFLPVGVVAAFAAAYFLWQSSKEPEKAPSATTAPTSTDTVLIPALKPEGEPEVKKPEVAPQEQPKAAEVRPPIVVPATSVPVVPPPNEAFKRIIDAIAQPARVERSPAKPLGGMKAFVPDSDDFVDFRENGKSDEVAPATKPVVVKTESSVSSTTTDQMEEILGTSPAPTPPAQKPGEKARPVPQPARTEVQAASKPPAPAPRTKAKVTKSTKEEREMIIPAKKAISSKKANGKKPVAAGQKKGRRT